MPRWMKKLGRSRSEEGGRPSEPASEGEPRSMPPPSPPAAVDPEAETLAIGRSDPGRPPAPEPPTEVAPPEPTPPAVAAADALPEPPTIGQVSESWRRRLPEAGWPRPGYAADGGSVGSFTVRAASVVGQGHLHRGLQRQDAYHFAALGEQAVVAIADGVSQKPLAAIGAEVAAFSVVRRYVERALIAGAGPDGRSFGKADLLADAVDDADAEVRRAAAELAVDPRELSTTMLVAALELERGGAVAVTIAAVGNSSAFAMASEELPAVLSGPSAQEGASAYGDFVPGPAGRARIDRAHLQPEATLVLATDGLADDLLSSPELRRWFWARLTGSRTPLELAHALSYRRQGSTDDLTALAVSAFRRP